MLILAYQRLSGLWPMGGLRRWEVGWFSRSRYGDDAEVEGRGVIGRVDEAGLLSSYLALDFFLEKSYVLCLYSCGLI